MSVSAGPPSDREGKVGTALVAGGTNGRSCDWKTQTNRLGPAMAVLERGGEGAAGGPSKCLGEAASSRAARVCRATRDTGFFGALESVVYSALPLFFASIDKSAGGAGWVRIQ